MAGAADWMWDIRDDRGDPELEGRNRYFGNRCTMRRQGGRGQQNRGKGQSVPAPFVYPKAKGPFAVFQSIGLNVQLDDGLKKRVRAMGASLGLSPEEVASGIIRQFCSEHPHFCAEAGSGHIQGKPGGETHGERRPPRDGTHWQNQRTKEVENRYAHEGGRLCRHRRRAA